MQGSFLPSPKGLRRDSEHCGKLNITALASKRHISRVAIGISLCKSGYRSECCAMHGLRDLQHTPELLCALLLGKWHLFHNAFQWVEVLRTVLGTQEALINHG